MIRKSGNLPDLRYKDCREDCLIDRIFVFRLIMEDFSFSYVRMWFK